MAFDKSGKYHMSPHHAKMADGIPKKPTIKDAPLGGVEPETPDGGEVTEHTTLHDHGDGTFHTEGHDGEEVQHPSIHHALSHLAEKHGHEELAQHIMSHADGEQEAEMPPQHAGAGMMAGY